MGRIPRLDPHSVAWWEARCAELYAQGDDPTLSAHERDMAIRDWHEAECHRQWAAFRVWNLPWYVKAWQACKAWWRR